MEDIGPDGWMYLGRDVEMGLGVRFDTERKRGCTCLEETATRARLYKDL